MFTPNIGDRFAHPTADNPIGTVDRVTKSADGAIWLWSGDCRYPWHQCEPVGVWQALALEFVADLSNCSTYQQVTDLLAGLGEADRQIIWNACPQTLRARIHQLKNQSLPPVELIEIKPIAGNKYGETQKTSQAGRSQGRGQGRGSLPALHS